MEEIIRFVGLAQIGRFTTTELCAKLHISRKTDHKHLERYALGGWAAAFCVSRRLISTEYPIRLLFLCMKPIQRGHGVGPPLALS